ncbi:MAG: hypothetical protein L6W00_04155 [Lentisphaeria bacterium]|nr:MAG: hypothetical protein L6W00_04155 [Lentisphaeria bacterium]
MSPARYGSDHEGLDVFLLLREQFPQTGLFLKQEYHGDGCFISAEKANEFPESS